MFLAATAHMVHPPNNLSRGKSVYFKVTVSSWHSADILLACILYHNEWDLIHVPYISSGAPRELIRHESDGV